MQARRCLPGEGLQQHFAPRSGERQFRRHPDDLGIVGVGKDEAGALGQKRCRKVSADRPEEPVAIVEVALPFLIGALIGPAGLALDHPQFAPRTQSHQIDPEAGLGRQFL